MGWAARTKRDSRQKTEPSRVARAYRVKHVPEMYREGKGFEDAAGRGYIVEKDGSLRRVVLDPLCRVLMNETKKTANSE